MSNEKSKEEVIAMRVRNIIIGMGVLLAICIIALVGTLLLNYMEENKENTFPMSSNISKTENTILEAEEDDEVIEDEEEEVEYEEEIENELEDGDEENVIPEENLEEDSELQIVSPIGETYKEAKLTLEKTIIDGENLILKYNLKLIEPEDMLIKELHDKATIKYGDEVLEFNNLKDFGVFEKIGDTEYQIYKFYSIDRSKINDNMEFTSEMSIYRYDKTEYYSPSESEPDFLDVGKWKITLKLDKNQFGELKKYSLEGAVIDFVPESSEERVLGIPTLELNEIIQGNKTTRFNMKLKNSLPHATYFVEILDGEDNVLLEKDLQYFEGNEFAEIIVPKVDDNAKIKIIVYETEAGSGFETYTISENVYSKAIIDLDMAYITANG